MHKVFRFHVKADHPTTLPPNVERIKSEPSKNTVGSRKFTQAITKATSCPNSFNGIFRVIVRQFGPKKPSQMLFVQPQETLETFKTKIHQQFKISEEAHEVQVSVVVSIEGDYSYIFPIDSDLYFRTMKNNDMIYFKVVEKTQDDSLILEKTLSIDEKIEKKFEEAKNTGNLFDLTSCEDDN
jgi:hypothetical protein